MYKAVKKVILKNKEVYTLIGLGLFSLFLVLITPRGESQEKKDPAPKEAFSFDTVIPKGFSLVPIEIANYETLDSLLGPYGVVDLYTTALNPNEKSKRIAYRVKILRAPRNPSHFAILVPFEKVKSILKYPGPFMVSIQNPDSGGTVFEKEKPKTTSRVFYNLGE